MNFVDPSANRYIHLLNYAIDIEVSLEIMYRMIEIGGKDFLLKTSIRDCTALHYIFVHNRRLQLVPKLLEIGGRDLVMKRNKYSGYTALHFACLNEDSDDNDEATKKLIEFGGKKLVMIKDHDGNTALHHVSKCVISLKTIKMMIDVGGKDLLKKKNNEGYRVVQDLALTEDPDTNDDIDETLVLLIKEGIYHNVGGEFSLGGLLVNEIIEDWYRLWDRRLWLVLRNVYRQIQLEAPNKSLPFLHSMIMIRTVTDVIRMLISLCVGIVSMKDSLGRDALDVAIEMKRPYEQGLKEILEETAKTNGWDILHCAAERGLPWNNGMQKLVIENLGEAVNGVNKETGLKLFMTAAIGGDLDTIYSLTRMDPMYIV